MNQSKIEPKRKRSRISRQLHKLELLMSALKSRHAHLSSEAKMYTFCISHHLHHRMSTVHNKKAPKRLNVTSRPVATMKVDAHVHVWDSTTPSHPEHPLPPIIGNISDLINNMNLAGVDKAMVVQPINYMFDHTYVREAIRAYPTRLAGIGLANTTVSSEEACKELEQLIQDGFWGVRINPSFTGDTFRHETVDAVTKRASELDIPVALFAKPKHVPELEHLILSCPRAQIVLDHFAFASPDDHSTQQAVVALAERHPNIFVKLSAWFRVSKRGWPHGDLYPFVNSLVDAVGPERLLIGSDYPFVKEQYEYAKAFSLLNMPIKDDERLWIEGESAKKLYKL